MNTGKKTVKDKKCFTFKYPVTHPTIFCFGFTLTKQGASFLCCAIRYYLVHCQSSSRSSSHPQFLLMQPYILSCHTPLSYKLIISFPSLPLPSLFPLFLPLSLSLSLSLLFYLSLNFFSLSPCLSLSLSSLSFLSPSRPLFRFSRKHRS